MKMIERILNKYFANKAINFVKDKLIYIKIDKKIIKTKDRYILLIKNCKEKEEYYKEYIEILFEEGLEKFMYFYTEKDLKYLERASNILGK